MKTATYVCTKCEVQTGFIYTDAGMVCTLCKSAAVIAKPSLPIADYNLCFSLDDVAYLKSMNVGL